MIAIKGNNLSTIAVESITVKPNFGQEEEVPSVYSTFILKGDSLVVGPGQFHHMASVSTDIQKAANKLVQEVEIFLASRAGVESKTPGSKSNSLPKGLSQVEV
jgi:hypothetical protein